MPVRQASSCPMWYFAVFWYIFEKKTPSTSAFVSSMEMVASSSSLSMGTITPTPQVTAK